MTLTDLQKAFLSNRLISKDNVIDPATGAPLDWGALGGGTSQPLDSDLTAFAGLAIAADKLPYGTGSHTLGLADFTAAGRALVDDADAAAQRVTLGVQKRAVSVSIGDPNGAVIVAGVKFPGIAIPFAWTDIESVTVVGDASGSISWTIRKATFNVAPTWASIVSAAPPVLSGAVASRDSTLTGWTKTGSAGDLLEIGVSGTPATVKACSLTLILVQ